MAVAVYPERMDQIDPADVEASLRTLETYIHYICERTEFALTNTFRTTSGLGSSAQEVALTLQEAVDNLSAVSSQLADAQTNITRLQDDVGGLADTLSSFEPLLTGQSDGPAERVEFTAPGGGLPLKACTAAITPVQEGEGDPSPENVRPITGWTGLHLHVSPTEDAADGKTYAVDWTDEAGTVYGGTLDVLAGTLTVDRLGKVFDGTEVWTSAGSGTKQLYRYADNRGRAVVGDRASSHFLNATIITSSTAVGYYAYTSGDRTDTYVQFRPGLDAVTTVDTWKAWLVEQAQNGTPLVCWWVTPDPVTYQLTPQMVTTLAGMNNVWADTGDVTVEHGAYLAAMQAEIEKLQEGGN